VFVTLSCEICFLTHCIVNGMCYCINSLVHHVSNSQLRGFSVRALERLYVFSSITPILTCSSTCRQTKEAGGLITESCIALVFIFLYIYLYRLTLIRIIHPRSHFQMCTYMQNFKTLVELSMFKIQRTIHLFESQSHEIDASFFCLFLLQYSGRNVFVHETAVDFLTQKYLLDKQQIK